MYKGGNGGGAVWVHSNLLDTARYGSIRLIEPNVSTFYKKHNRAESSENKQTLNQLDWACCGSMLIELLDKNRA